MTGVAGAGGGEDGGGRGGGLEARKGKENGERGEGEEGGKKTPPVPSSYSTAVSPRIAARSSIDF